jgi:DivIVA domain-containing protein
VAKLTIIDIQHKEFKKSLQGYDRNEVNEFLDEIIEALEDEAQHRAALEGEIGDLRERISHFKAMEESLQSTLLLAQRTADEPPTKKRTSSSKRRASSPNARSPRSPTASRNSDARPSGIRTAPKKRRANCVRS